MPVITVSYRWILTRILVVGSAGLLFAGCQSTAGTVSDGRYVAPENLFSMQVPQLSLGLAVEDGFGKSPDGGLRAGFVSFHDDFGQVRSITYEEMDEETTARIEARPSSYFRDGYVSQLRERLPGTRVIHESPMTLSDTTGHFAVLEIPGGSPLMVIDAEHPEGRRMDSTRGFLVVTRGRLLLTLSVANDNAFASTRKASSAGDLNVDLLKTILTELYESIRFD